MSEQDNIRVVQDLYAAMGSGDIATNMALWTDDCEYHLPGPTDILPWAGTRRGKVELQQFFEQVQEWVEFELFEGQEYIAQGQTVVVLGTERFRVKATGKVVDNDFAYVYTVRDGKVATCREYNDTAAHVVGAQ